MPSPEWMADAACKDTGPALFFADKGEELVARARAACAECPVRQPCLDYAVDNCERFGVWGGTTPKERRRIRRSRARGRIRDDDGRWMPTKADCPGCVAERDELGRYPIGFCGPDCVRRKAS